MATWAPVLSKRAVIGRDRIATEACNRSHSRSRSTEMVEYAQAKRGLWLILVVSIFGGDLSVGTTG